MKTFYEFFAGGGMANAGLGPAWECVFANDFCEKKSAAYKANWGADHFVPGDVAEVTPEHLLGRADLAWASFPCQDLSLAGNGRGLNGERSGTFWKFIELMSQLKGRGRKPRIIALENVYGAVTSRSGQDFEALISAVAGEGYRVGAMIINAAHFVPQSRPRLFIVAIDESLTVPDQITSTGPMSAWHPTSLVRVHDRLSQALKERWIWWSLPTPAPRRQSLEDIIENNPVGVEWHSQAETKRLLKMMTPKNLDKLKQVQKTGKLRVGTLYRRTRNGVQRAELRFDGIAGCLRTPSGGSSRQTIVVVSGQNVRSRLLSPREAARLMGLDENYILPERYNDAYHLAGDGVAVPVVDHLARNIFEPILDVNEEIKTAAAA